MSRMPVWWRATSTSRPRNLVASERRRRADGDEPTVAVHELDDLPKDGKHGGVVEAVGVVDEQEQVRMPAAHLDERPDVCGADDRGPGKPPVVHAVGDDEDRAPRGEAGVGQRAESVAPTRTCRPGDEEPPSEVRGPPGPLVEGRPGDADGQPGCLLDPRASEFCRRSRDISTAGDRRQREQAPGAAHSGPLTGGGCDARGVVGRRHRELDLAAVVDADGPPGRGVAREVGGSQAGDGGIQGVDRTDDEGAAGDRCPTGLQEAPSPGDRPDDSDGPAVAEHPEETPDELVRVGRWDGVDDLFPPVDDDEDGRAPIAVTSTAGLDVTPRRAGG